MDFALTDAQQQIRDQVLRICSQFDDTYWLERDRTATFPEAFFAAMAEGNWLGIAMPEQYGGAGLGITEAAVMMQAVAESGAAMSGASAIHINIFGLNPVVIYGTEEQKRRMLPPLLRAPLTIACCPLGMFARVQRTSHDRPCLLTFTNCVCTLVFC